MSHNDVEYFRERAVTERALAHAATNARAILVHQEMAERYEVLVRAEGHLKVVSIAPTSPTRVAA